MEKGSIIDSMTEANIELDQHLDYSWKRRFGRLKDTIKSLRREVGKLEHQQANYLKTIKKLNAEILKAKDQNFRSFKKDEMAAS